MNVESLIKRLKAEPQDRILTYGFDRLSMGEGENTAVLTPANNIRVSEMLALVKAAKKSPFMSTKGKTRVYLQGNNRFKLPFGPTLYSLMFHGGPARFGVAPKLGARNQIPN